ncbi:MAG TPA: hypothetical protein VMI31_10595 [Fimbriimonadaceae bacterium]|nr:hypothetical protein [Fimbriimonadaceae bacterium]
MHRNGLKTLMAGLAMAACLALPMIGAAQHYGLQNHSGYNHADFRYDRRDMKNWVDAMERESNSFRAYFEHNFKAYGHPHRYDSRNDSDHPEHEGANGQMTLKDAIQNMDEDFERLRAEVDHHGDSREARDLMNEIVDHSRDVDVRIDRVADNYRFNDDRNWRYDRGSELYRRWQDLKADIRDLAGGMRRR